MVGIGRRIDKNTYLKTKKSCRGGICAVMEDLGEHQLADLPKCITLKASDLLTFNRKIFNCNASNTINVFAHILNVPQE